MPQYTVGERIEVLCNAPMVTAPSSKGSTNPTNFPLRPGSTYVYSAANLVERDKFNPNRPDIAFTANLVEREIASLCERDTFSAQ